MNNSGMDGLPACFILTKPAEKRKGCPVHPDNPVYYLKILNEKCRYSLKMSRYGIFSALELIFFAMI